MRVARKDFAAHMGTETPVVARLDPVFDPIRADPAFAALVAERR